jgi:hypothetical protein
MTRDAVLSEDHEEFLEHIEKIVKWADTIGIARMKEDPALFTEASDFYQSVKIECDELGEIILHKKQKPKEIADALGSLLALLKFNEDEFPLTKDERKTLAVLLKDLGGSITAAHHAVPASYFTDVTRLKMDIDRESELGK